MKPEDNVPQWDLLTKIFAVVIAFGGSWLVVKAWVIPNLRSFLFNLWTEEKEGLPMLREMVTHAFLDRIKKVDNNSLAIDDLIGRVNVVELGVKAHSIQISEIKAHADGVPELSRILAEIRDNNRNFTERFELIVDRFTDEITSVKQGIARMEGKWDGINRRQD